MNQKFVSPCLWHKNGFLECFLLEFFVNLLCDQKIINLTVMCIALERLSRLFLQPNELKRGKIEVFIGEFIKASILGLNFLLKFGRKCIQWIMKNPMYYHCGKSTRNIYIYIYHEQTITLVKHSMLWRLAGILFFIFFKEIFWVMLYFLSINFELCCNIMGLMDVDFLCGMTYQYVSL